MAGNLIPVAATTDTINQCCWDSDLLVSQVTSSGCEGSLASLSVNGHNNPVVEADPIDGCVKAIKLRFLVQE